MATRHTYASSDDLRDYLAGTSFSSGWTSDAGSIRRILEASSRRIDFYCEGGTFGPLTAVRCLGGSRNLEGGGEADLTVTPAGGEETNLVIQCCYSPKSED